MPDRFLSLRVAAATFSAACCFAVAPCHAQSEPAADEAKTQQLSAALAAYNDSAHFALPAVSEAQLRRLARGKVVRIREPSEAGGPQRITGILLCAAGRDDLWVALRDPHLTSLPELTEVRISADGDWPTLWYQYFHMPGPFTDRHWVIAVDDNLALASGSEDRRWEHYWRLQPSGLALGLAAVGAGRIPRVTDEMASSAISPSTNEGAWVVISLGDGATLLGYTVRASIGGRIPDRLVASYSMFTIARLLRRVEQRAAVASEHYDGAHRRIRGGGGAPLP